MTPALYRVRKPFFWRNVIGLGLVGVIPLAVYGYTWVTIAKDDFSDIPIPPISDSDLTKLKSEYEARK